ncbi:MAG: hypothetical protein P8Y44_00870 [Acidobacteriota bacterium]
MQFTSVREKSLWWAAFICLLVIYSSLYIARPIAEYLRERNLLGAAVGLVFALTAVPVVIMARRWNPGWRVALGFVMAGILYVPVFLFLELPEERLHYLQYGLLCGLIHGALRERRRNRPLSEWAGMLRRVVLSPWLIALILTAGAGWLDEGIQKLLPNRYYDLRDVAFNVSAAILYLIAWKVVEASRRWEARSLSESVDT